MHEPRPTSPAIDPSLSTQRKCQPASRMACIVLFCLALIVGACGSGSDDAEVAEEATSQESSTSSSEAGEGASPQPQSTAIDLTTVSACIAAADIVVAPTSYSAGYLSEQQIAATLDLGALGNEFGGGQLFVFETVARADEMYAILSDDTDAAVRQDGATLLEYRSAVQDEAADIVMACAAA